MFVRHRRAVQHGEHVEPTSVSVEARRPRGGSVLRLRRLALAATASFTLVFAWEPPPPSRPPSRQLPSFLRARTFGFDRADRAVLVRHRGCGRGEARTGFVVSSSRALPSSDFTATATAAVPSSPPSSSAALSWNQRARHCCAVRPVSILLMLLHRGPGIRGGAGARVSSSVHASFFTLGSRWRRQRPMHCWSVRPSRWRAISAHRWPCSSYNFASCERGGEGRWEASVAEKGKGRVAHIGADTNRAGAPRRARRSRCWFETGDVRSRGSGFASARGAGRSRRYRASRRNTGAGVCQNVIEIGRKDARARRARAHLRVLLRGPLLLLNAGLTLCRHRARARPVLPGSRPRRAPIGCREFPEIRRRKERQRRVVEAASRASRRKGGRGMPLRSPTNNPAPRKKMGAGSKPLWAGTHLQPGELGVLLRTPH